MNDNELVLLCAEYHELTAEITRVGPEQAALQTLDMDQCDMWRRIEDWVPVTDEGTRARAEVMIRGDWRTKRVQG
jgi:hypothetical protein